MNAYFQQYNLFDKLAIFKVIIPALFIVSVFFGCTRLNERTSSIVYLKKEKETYILYRNQKPYAIKGAAGYSHFSDLQRSGGNTLRVWDTVGLANVLDSAKANNLAVVVGLPLANSDYMELYNDSLKVSKQYKAFKTIVTKFKDHPAVLMWCMGNELDFPFKPAYKNFYKAFNEISAMIRREDPDHPITTTVLNFNKKYIFNIAYRCDIDIISFNIFSRIIFLRDDLKSVSYFWKGPYMLTEWGVDGPWDGTPQTAWGAYIETASNKKAELYLTRYKKYMPVEDPRFLGCFTFFWGNKQEGTHTWFSLFDENGTSSEAAGIMQSIWKDEPEPDTYPQIKYMLLDKKSAIDNIILPAGSNSMSEVLVPDQNKIKSIKWQIFKEDWYKKNNLHNIKKLKPLEGLMKGNESLKVDFRVPFEEGPYRIFATIYDKNGHFATCNIPFYVVTDK